MPKIEDTDINLYFKDLDDNATHSLNTNLIRSTVRYTRNVAEEMFVTVARDDVVLTADPWDDVILETKDTGEGTYMKRFWGFISRVATANDVDTVELVCHGMIKKLDYKMIPNRIYANTFIDQGRYSFIYVSDESIYIQLSQVPSGDCDPQTPLLVEQHDMNSDYFELEGWGAITHVPIQNNVGTYSAVYFPFDKVGGLELEVWVMLSKSGTAGGPSNDLNCYLWEFDYTDGTLTGSALASFTVSGGMVTAGTFTWVKIDFADQTHDYSNTLTKPAYAIKFIQNTADNTQNDSVWSLRVREESFQSRKHSTFIKWGSLGAYSYTGIDMTYHLIFTSARWKTRRPETYRVDVENQRICMGCMAAGSFKNNYTRFDSKQSILTTRIREIELFRVTYLKGNLVYSSTIKEFYTDWISDLCDTCTVTLSNPKITFGGVVIENMSVRAALDELLKYAGASYRMYMQTDGTKVFEVANTKTPGDWGDYVAGEQDLRSLFAGADATSTTQAGFVKITSAKIEKNITLAGERYMLRSAAGITISERQITSTPNTYVSPVIGMNGVEDNKMVESMEGIYSGTVDYNTYAEIEAVDIDMSTSGALFADCNELVKVVDSEVGLNDNMGLKEITLKIEVDGGISFRFLTEKYSEVSMRPVVDQSASSDDSAGKFGDILGGIAAFSRDTRAKLDYDISRGGSPGFQADAVPQLDRYTEIFFAKDLSLTHDGSSYYWLAVGDGIPSDANTLGNLLCYCLGSSITTNGVNKQIQAVITGADMRAVNATMPHIVSEIAIYKSATIAGAKTVVPGSAKSIGKAPGLDVSEVVPKVYNKGKVTLIYKISAAQITFCRSSTRRLPFFV